MNFLRLISTVFVSFLVLLFSCEAKAEETIFFRINNSDIDSGFKDNASVLHNLETLLASRVPAQVRIHAAASPDGPTALNTRLSRERAYAGVTLLKSMCPQLPDSVFTVTTTAEDIDGTLSLISKSGQEWADEAKQILSRSVSNPEEGLRHIHGGKVWRYLADEVFPLLRKTEIEFVFETEAVIPAATDTDSASEAPVEQISAQSSGNSSGLPWWSIALMALLGGGTVAFGGLYFSERNKNRNLPKPSAEPAEPSEPEVEPEAGPELEPAVEEPVVEEPISEPVSAPDVPIIPVVPVVPVTEEEPEAPEAPAEPSVFASKVYDLINDNIDDPDFGVEQLAGLMGMSRIHLNRKLKAESIASPSALLKEARMKLASRLIRENTLSMAEISSKCGFATPSYFSTAFKDFYGVTPSEYK